MTFALAVATPTGVAPLRTVKVTVPWLTVSVATAAVTVAFQSDVLCNGGASRVHRQSSSGGRFRRNVDRRADGSKLEQIGGNGRVKGQRGGQRAIAVTEERLV